MAEPTGLQTRGRYSGLARTGLPVGLAILALAAAGAPPALANPCRKPLKYADGTCVRACPAGYADRGRKCVYRNESH